MPERGGGLGGASIPPRTSISLPRLLPVPTLAGGLAGLSLPGRHAGAASGPAVYVPGMGWRSPAGGSGSAAASITNSWNSVVGGAAASAASSDWTVFSGNQTSFGQQPVVAGATALSTSWQAAS